MRALLGVNLPYFQGAYGHDLAPSARHPDWPVSFDLSRAYRPLLEARALGLEAVRIWLCEGAEGLIVDGEGRVTGVHPRLLESIALLDEGARVAGVRIYWTLLDANAAARDGDAITRSILADRDRAARFAEHVVAPVARAIDPRVAVGLEIVNEPEVVTESCADVRAPIGGASIGWDAIGALIGASRTAARAEKGDLVITAGTGHVFLPALWSSGAELDAVDVHVYLPSGGLPPREHLARDVGDRRLLDDAIPLIAGECGIPKQPGADPKALANFLSNATPSGYSAVFLWKLEGDLVDAKAEGRPVTELGHTVRAEARKRA